MSVQFFIEFDDDCIGISPEDQPLVNRAMLLWTEQHRDSWIEVASPAGCTVHVLASSIIRTTASTLDQRRAVAEIQKAMDDERKELRKAAGFLERE